MEKRKSLQQIVLGKVDCNMEKTEIGQLSYTILKINSKWMKDLNMRQINIKVLEETIDSNSSDIGLRNFYSR